MQKWTLVEAYLLCKKAEFSQTWEKLSFILQHRNGRLRKFSIGLGRLPSLIVNSLVDIRTSKSKESILH